MNDRGVSHLLRKCIYIPVKKLVDNGEEDDVKGL